MKTIILTAAVWLQEVVLDENGNELALTEADNRTQKKIEVRLAGQGDDMKPPSLPVNNRVNQLPSNSRMQTNNSTVKISQEFLYAVRTGSDIQGSIHHLQAMEYPVLKAALRADDEKKAFWINVYNGYTQYLLQRHPELYRNRNVFFNKKQITVASRQFSLDDIEHGILRRSKIKWSLGYMDKLFPSKTEKELRVTRLDYRIHFALNCGAKSCPPIAFYTPERLEQQLDLATRSYLSGEVEVKEDGKTILLPAIMNWFRGDFGGKKGLRALLQHHGINYLDSFTRMKFKAYDWNLFLENFRNP